MYLTPLGANVAQQIVGPRNSKASNLLGFAHPVPMMNKYVGGVCYDVVAFTRYLLGAQISPNQLIDVNAQQWAQIFMRNARPWHGNEMPVGTAMIFCNYDNNVPFHAAIIAGYLGFRSTVIRGDNGNTLGAGWVPQGDRNLADLTNLEGNIYEDPMDKRKFKIYISNL